MKSNHERFTITYKLSGNEKEAYEKAKDICFEQTVELPENLITNDFIKNHVVGRIDNLIKNADESYQAKISFAVESVGYELTQFLNVIFGNISLKPGIRLEEIELSQSLFNLFKGPKFGIEGLRKHLEVNDRPILATALKPMGLTAKELASLAYKFAIGGIDIIKDDHGLANQTYASFDDRLKYCAEAVQKANNETGSNSIYVPNITATVKDVFNRAKSAKNNGAGGLLISPAIIGFDVMRELSCDDKISLPIISHPAFLGSYLINSINGISHYALLGQLMRITGADAVIYPNHGGRFSFSQEECNKIIEGTKVSMGRIKPILPAPGGGMNLSNIKDMNEFYGKDVIYLIGGGLFKHSNDLVANCKYFKSLIS